MSLSAPISSAAVQVSLAHPSWSMTGKAEIPSVRVGVAVDLLL